MYCRYCGKEMPDDADFCFQCGKAQKTDEPGEPAVDVRWEFCKIDFRVKTGEGRWFYTKPVLCWVAEANGEHGKYDAGLSEDFYGERAFWGGYRIPWRNEKDRRIASQAFHNLKEKLLAEGWEYVEDYGELFYEVRYRRLVK